MDHEQATRIQAPSRYLDGDLSPSEAEAFEEHYFSCPECAQEIRTGLIFDENLRAVLRERTVFHMKPARRQFWISPAFAAPMAAAICCLAVLCYQSAITIPRLQADVKSLTSGGAPYSFALKLARGAPATIPHGAVFFMPYFYLPAHTPSATYRCVFETLSGSRVTERIVAEPQAGQPIQLLLRRSEFPSGSYLLKVRGEHSTDPIATYNMDVSYPIRGD